MSATQGVVFALGGEKRFGGLVTQDSPRCLLDLGFQPMAWYALRALERANVLDVFLVAAGEHSAARFEDFVREQYKGPCRVAVVAAAEDADSADALRAVADRLTSRSVAVLSGDLVTDVALADVLDAHDSAGGRAVATCVSAASHPRRRTYVPSIKNCGFCHDFLVLNDLVSAMSRHSARANASPET